MIVADLHVHTTESDGTMTFTEVTEAARHADLAAVAITDHDVLHPALDAPLTHLDGENEVVGRDGLIDDSTDAGGDDVGTDADDTRRGPRTDRLTVIRGIELRVDAGFESVDLLGYAGRQTAALTAELDRLGKDRIERGRAIADCVEDRLGVDLGIAVDANTGRPHVARAIAASDADYGYREAFEHLIGEHCPCYVPRDLPSVEEGVSLLADACGVVSLAHPFRYRNVERTLELCSEFAIDAIERYYPYGRSVDEALCDQVIADHSLIATGGSDAHDAVLGRAGLSKEGYEPFAARLSRP